MSDRRKDHAQRLAAYVRAMLAPGQSMRSFCAERGLDNARISAWESNGGDVSIDHMRTYGDALGLTLGQVMIAAGYGDEDDFGAAPPPPVAPNVSIDFAIEHDPDLSDFARRTFREMRATIRAVESGQVESVSNAGGKPRARRRG